MVSLAVPAQRSRRASSWLLDGLKSAIWVMFAAAVLTLGVNWAWEHEL